MIQRSVTEKRVGISLLIPELPKARVEETETAEEVRGWRVEGGGSGVDMRTQMCGFTNVGWMLLSCRQRIVHSGCISAWI